MKIEQHFNEQNRRDLGIVWFIIGFIFIVSRFPGGLLFWLLGLIWLATSRGQGLEWSRENPREMRTFLLSTTIILITLALILFVRNAIS